MAGDAARAMPYFASPGGHEKGNLESEQAQALLAPETLEDHLDDALCRPWIGREHSHHVLSCEDEHFAIGSRNMRALPSVASNHSLSEAATEWPRRWWLVGALWQITAIESRRQGCGRIRHGSMSVALAFLDGMCLLANARAHPHVRVLAVRTSLMLA